MNRALAAFAAALIALFGSLTAVFATIQTRDFELRGYVDPTQTKELPYKQPGLGVNVELTQYDEEALRQNLSQIEQAGFVWLRQFVYWDEIEPRQGHFEWEEWDRIAAALNDYANFRLVVVFMNSPAWARANRDHFTTPPDHPEDLAAFVSSFAKRYGDLIDAYQIWDEPNLRDAWGGNDPRPAEYLAMLCASYTALHGSDTASEVIGAALAPTIETGPRNIADSLFLRQLYELGAKDCMDGAAAKPYGFDLPPLDRTVKTETLNFSRMVALREVMLAYGDGQKALWGGSWGWNHLPADWRGAPSIWGAVSAQEQVDYTRSALDRLDREWPWAGPMLLYHWQPDLPHNHPAWGFALINQQNEPSPLLTALSSRPKSQAAANGLFHPVTPYARYTGIWTFGPLGADIGWLETSDSRVEFDFAGSDLSLLLREDDYVAFLYPTIDGQPANAAPIDSSGNAYLFLRSASLQPEINLTRIAANLESGVHTLHMITDKGWDRWALAGYAVSSGDLAAPYNHQITLAAISLMIAVLAVFVTARELPLHRYSRPIVIFFGGVGSAAQLVIGIITTTALMISLLLTWGDGTPAFFRKEPIQLGLSILTAGLIYLELSFLVTIALIVLLFVFIYNRLELGLILSILWAPFFLFPIELYRFAFPMSEILILLTTAAWILRLFVQWGISRQSANSQFSSNLPSQIFQSLHPVDFAAVGFVLLGTLSLLWTERRDVALTELRTMLIEPVLFYIMVRTHIRQDEALIRLVYALIAAGVIVSVVGLLQFILGISLITAEEGVQRLAGVYGSPNNLALFLGRCIPFALAFALIDRRRWQKGLSSAALLVMTTAAILTQSVGALLIGIPAAIAVVIILHFKRRAGMILGPIIIGVLILVLILSSISPRFSGLFDLTRGTNFFRLRVWESALEMLQDHPITGVGLDQFLYAFRGHYIRPDAVWDRDLSHPHNFVLDFWLRLSIVGAALFLWVQIIFWKNIPRLINAAQSDTTKKTLLLGTAGAMFNLISHGLIDNSVFVNDLALVFFLLLAIFVQIANTRAIDHNFS